MMRRPLTVRWWFRVALIVVLLIGGYASVYMVLREPVWRMSGELSFKYALAERHYATGEVGQVYIQVLLDLHEVRFLSASTVNESYTPTRDEPELPRYSILYDAADGSGWAQAYRVFYLAERVELWVRGLSVVDGESIVISE